MASKLGSWSDLFSAAREALLACSPLGGLGSLSDLRFLGLELGFGFVGFRGFRVDE